MLEPNVDAIWAAAVAAYEDGVPTYLSETDEVENEELNRTTPPRTPQGPILGSAARQGAHRPQSLMMRSV